MAKILIVEPDNETMSDIELILQTQGYSTMKCNSVEEALTLTNSSNPDLIISETRFDGMSGYDLLKSINKKENKLEIPFIFLSIVGNERMIRKAMNLGADDFIVKPFAATDLLLSVKARLYKYFKQLDMINSTIPNKKQDKII